MGSKRKTKKHIPDLPPLQAPVPPRPAPSRAPAARSIFAAANIEVDESGEPWVVVGRFLYWPLSDRWRSKDEAHLGYRASELVGLIRRQAAASPEGFAAVAAALEPSIQENAYDA